MKVLSFTLILGLIGANALADKEGGSDRGGGHAYVCFKDPKDRDKVEATVINNRKNQSKNDPFTGIDFNTLKVEVLDYSHAVNKYGLENLIEANGSAEKIAEKQLTILRNKTTYGDDILELFKKKTRPSLWVKSKNGLSEIDDSKYPPLLQNDCLQMQMALQDDFDIFHDPRLRAKLDTLNDVALVLHETFYRFARALGHVNSVAVRNFVALMLTKEFETLSGSEIMNIIWEKKLHKPNTAYYEEHIAQFTTLPNTAVTLDVVGNGGLPLMVERNLGYSRETERGKMNLLPVWRSKTIANIPLKGRFDENGVAKNYLDTDDFIHYFIIVSDDNVLLGGVLGKNIVFKGFPLKGDKTIEFFKPLFGEKLYRGTLSENLTIDGVPCAANGSFSLSENGTLSKCSVAPGYTYYGVKVRPGSSISLKEIAGKPQVYEFVPDEDIKIKEDSGWFGSKTKICLAGIPVKLDDAGVITGCGYKD